MSAKRGKGSRHTRRVEAGEYASWDFDPSDLPGSTPDGEKLSWVIRDEPRLAFGFVDRGSRIVWSSFAYLGGEDEELSSRAWRNLNLATVAEEARKVLALHLAAEKTRRTRSAKAKVGDAKTAAAFQEAYLAADKRLRGKRPRGTAFTSEELEHYARLYREGLRAQPRSPLKYVQEHLGRDDRGRLLYPHRSSAQRRVEAARRAGLLDGIE